MSDAIIVQIISNSFWLILFVLIIVSFRKEIKKVLSSLGKFSVAGANFELNDAQSTIQSYAILSGILIDILSYKDLSDKLLPIISDKNVQALCKFAKQYANEINPEDQDLILLRNIALLAYNKERYKDSITILDSILKQNPTDYEILNRKGMALLDNRTKPDLEEANKLFDTLVEQRPATSSIWYNRALVKTQLHKYDEALSSLETAIKYEMWKYQPDMLEIEELDPLRENRTEEFTKLKTKIESLKNNESK